MKKTVLALLFVFSITNVSLAQPTLESSSYPGVKVTHQNSQIHLWGEDGERKWAIGGSGRSNNDDFIFYDDDSNISRLTIKGGNGDVGIGIDNPSGKFHVGRSGGAGLIIEDIVDDISPRTSAIIGWANNNLLANGNNASGLAGDLAIAPRTDINGASIRFFTRYSNNISEKFRISPTGNIGIGVKIPSSPLHISNNQDNVITLQSMDDTWIYTNYLNSTGQRKAYIGLNQDLTNYVFKVENGANRFSFMGGAVGINTLNLQPGYQLAVNGNIIAKEIKVNTNWSDFVFEDTYKLPTLKEVEQHIEEKGHLKDIPSAKEVEENGIHLGEMDSKLLQKIEELMLYTIQQQKEIEQLKRENIELKKLSDRIDKLEKK